MKNQILILAITFLIASLTAQQKGTSPLITHRSSLTISSTYAVVVGISDYQDPAIPDLRFADKDAEAFANYLRSNAGGELDNDHMKVLINQQATMAQFGIALDWLWEVCKEGDRAIIYFSGHGDVEKKSLTQPGFLLCWDAPAHVYMSGGAFALPMLQEVISTLSIQNKAKVIVITDACRSGILAGNSVGGSQATAANLAKQYTNEIKIMSCQPNEFSIEGEQWGGGRGAFSFHLIDALYGMADTNDDQFITLQEVGRYLEDHVSNEVAPISQVPMIIGNRNERLTNIDATLLASIKSGKTNQMTMLSSIESKGLEEDVLSKVDTTIRELYFLFNKALKNKVFLEPVGKCADQYYEKLIAEPGIKQLHSTIKRNYAAALQDDAQQVINNWLKSDFTEFGQSKQTKIKKYGPYPRYLERAGELLGKQHYMYSVLQARKLLFEGYLLSLDENVNKEVGNKALKKFRQSLELQAGQPHAYMFMSDVFAENLLQPDSCEYYALYANSLLPSWVIPVTHVAFFNTEIWRNYNRAKYFLEKANLIDSNEIYAINAWAVYYLRLKEYSKAIELFKKIILKDSGNRIAHSNLGLLYTETKNYHLAVDYFQKAIRCDSTDAIARNNLGMVFGELKQLEKAEQQYKKAIELDPKFAMPYSNLGIVYSYRKDTVLATQYYKKSIELNPFESNAYINLGLIYTAQKNYSWAQQQFKKAIEIDSTLPLAYNNLGLVYSSQKNYAIAEQLFNKSIEVDSLFAMGYINLAYIYHTTNQYAKAEEYYIKAIKLDSNLVYPYQYLAWMSVEFKRYSDAEKYLKKAIELDTTNSNAYPFFLLGEVYVMTNRLNEADPLLQKAIQLNPEYTETYYVLSCMHGLQNHIDIGFEYLEKALTRGYSEYDWLQKDPDLLNLREHIEQWKVLMKKYFPDKIK